MHETTTSCNNPIWYHLTILLFYSYKFKVIFFYIGHEWVLGTVITSLIALQIDTKSRWANMQNSKTVNRRSSWWKKNLTTAYGTYYLKTQRRGTMHVHCWRNRSCNNSPLGTALVLHWSRICTILRVCFKWFSVFRLKLIV